MTLSLQVLLAGGSGGVPPGFLGYCPQESALWPGLTVREHLEVSAAVKGLQRADAAAAITRCVAGHHLLPTWAETPSHRMRRADSSILVDRLIDKWDFLGVSEDKESACNAGDQVRSLDQEDPLEKGMITHSSILAWKIPWTEDLASYSPWSLEESDITE